MFNHVHTLCQHRHVQSTQPSTSNSTQVVMKRLVAFPGITAPQLAGGVPWFAATGTWARASPATPPRHGGSCGRPHHPGDGRGPPWRPGKERPPGENQHLPEEKQRSEGNRHPPEESQVWGEILNLPGVSPCAPRFCRVIFVWCSLAGLSRSFRCGGRFSQERSPGHWDVSQHLPEGIPAGKLLPGMNQHRQGTGSSSAAGMGQSNALLSQDFMLRIAMVWLLEIVPLSSALDEENCSFFLWSRPTYPGHSSWWF